MGAGGEVGLLQDRWHAQHEAEEQACHEGAEGRQPLHQGALCLQGEARLEDSARPAHEEAQGDALSQERKTASRGRLSGAELTRVMVGGLTGLFCTSTYSAQLVAS